MCCCVLQAGYACVIWNIHMYGSTFVHVHNAKPMRNNECIHTAIKINTATCSSRPFRKNCCQPHTDSPFTQGRKFPLSCWSRTQGKVLVLPMFLKRFFPAFCIAEHQHLEMSAERRAASHAQAPNWLSRDHCIALCRARNSALGSTGTHIHWRA